MSNFSRLLEHYRQEVRGRLLDHQCHLEEQQRLREIGDDYKQRYLAMCDKYGDKLPLEER